MSQAPQPATTPTGYQTPEGTQKTFNWKSPRGQDLPYDVSAGWIVLRKKETPAAEIFHTYYKLSGATGPRPLTFVFNGGPGASSAYLHIGGLAPERVRFEADGSTPPPPAVLENNTESWLEFTDLVFVDPVGTGFSRIIEADKKEGEGKDKKSPDKTVDEKEFYQLKRDLESLGEFIERFLSIHQLWHVPVSIAGESYGGFRSAKLARLLQEKHGIGLQNVFAISPALEWSLLNSSDYDVLHTVDTFCTMALAATFHGHSRKFPAKTPVDKQREKIETFAGRDLAQALLLGDSLNEGERQKIFSDVADFLGIPLHHVQRSGGRVPFWRFARELFKESRRVIGFYDATMTAIDPFPDREMHEAPDPTLIGIERVFAGGINHLLRSRFGVRTDRLYELLSMEVNMAWKRDDQKHAFDLIVGAVDDLRFAMSMNPYMKVYVCHGYYDMVTPYFSSHRLIEQMKLTPEQRRMISVRNFGGGHMFYTWEDSRREFRDWARGAYTNAK